MENKILQKWINKEGGAKTKPYYLVDLDGVSLEGANIQPALINLDGVNLEYANIIMKFDYIMN